MMQKLHCQTISRIRGDQVVSSFARVIEELVVNAIDAKATRIRIIMNAKKFFVRVEDNGHGISFEDLKVIGTNRNVTSKFVDLDVGHSTYGCRGESLCAIASFCEMKIVTTTKTNSSSSGWCKEIMKNGHFDIHPSFFDHHHHYSTSFSCHDLFYNRPVVRKSCKNQLDSILKFLKCIAVAHPSISFSLEDCESTLFHTKISNNIVASVFGPRLSETLVHNVRVEADIHGPFVVEGWFSDKPVTKTKELQIALLNSRACFRSCIHKWINQYYQQLLRIEMQSDRSVSKKYGTFICKITCPNENFFITYDPDKTLIEFKFKNQVVACIHELMIKIFPSCRSLHPNEISQPALPSAPSLVPITATAAASSTSIEDDWDKIATGIFDMMEEQGIEEFVNKTVKRKTAPTQMTPTPKAIDQYRKWNSPVPVVPAHMLASSSCRQVAPTVVLRNVRLDKNILPSASVISQLDNKFILFCCGGQLLAMDQHAASERIRLESLQQQVKDMNIPPTPLQLRPNRWIQFPDKISFDLLKQSQQLLHSWSITVSFEDSNFQGGSWNVAVSQIPSFLSSANNTDLSDILLELITTGKVNGSSLMRTLATHACRGAIMFGDELSVEECRDLMQKLSKCQLPFQCAHGRPSLVPLIDLTQKSHPVIPPPNYKRIKKHY